MPQTSLYIHIPFCRGKCPYCGFYSKPIGSFDTARYIQAVLAEIETLNLAPEDVRTIYIGGGTPTVLPASQLESLLNFLTTNFTAVEEFTIETNPTPKNASSLDAIFSSAVNRVSIGVQSFYADELKTLGRGYDVRDIPATIDNIRDHGIDNISIDLIFAIPGSNIDKWRHNLQQAVSLPVKHISAYSLSFDEGTHFTKLLQAGRLTPTGDETDRQMYNDAIDTFTANGFNQYEISNFAIDGFECRHNLTYWNNLDYVGVGASAGSFHNRMRSENIADINRYINAIETDSSPKQYSTLIEGKQYACETAVLMLRKREGIGIEEFKLQTGFDLLETFPNEIETNIKNGMLKIKAGRLLLTRNALHIADNILCDFAS